MPESLDAYAELREIRARVEGIEHRQEMLVRAHAEEILRTIWEYIDREEALGDVYLLVDGKRTQQDIIQALNDQGINVSQPTVSRRVATLMTALGLIEIAERDSAGVRYRKSELDRILHLTPKVERRIATNRKAAKKSPKKA